MSDWMSELPVQVRHMPLTKLIFPGTSHSAAYQILPKRIDSWRSRFALRSQIANRTLHQTINLTQQLDIGVRSFDFRISYDQEYYLSNRHLCMEAVAALAMIRRFLSAHLGEVIIVRVQMDSPMDVATVNGFFEMCLQETDEILPDLGSLSNISLATIKRRLIMIYNGSAHHVPWDYTILQMPLVKFGEKRDQIQEFIDFCSTKPPKHLAVLSCAVVAKKKMTSKILQAQVLQHAIPDWFELLPNINIVETDFVTAEFIHWIIQQNRLKALL